MLIAETIGLPCPWFDWGRYPGSARAASVKILPPVIGIEGSGSTR